MSTNSMSTWRILRLALVALAAWACAGCDEPAEGTPDGGVEPDAAALVDGATRVDAATPPVDAAMPDAGPPSGCGWGEPSFTPVLFSPTDHTDNVVVGADGLDVESRGPDRGGARSDTALMPGSGVFYYEAELLGEVRSDWGFGVATADEDLVAVPGRSAESVGMVTYAGFINDEIAGAPAGRCDATELGWGHERVGFVVDYRAANPVVYFMVDPGTGPEVGATCTMTGITAPVYVFYAGWRQDVGVHGRINTGNDTTNFPFAFDESALRSALDGASAGTGAALVMGWGQTRARAADSAPVLMPPADMSGPVGTEVTLTASANDPEFGDLSEQIEWADLATNHFAPEAGSGASFSFTPVAIGRHPVRLRVRDVCGRLAEATVMVTVTGALPTPDPVQLVIEPGTGNGMTLSADGLGVLFSTGHKDAILANQGLYGEFWYYEARRLSAVFGGAGLSVHEGSFSPYDFDDPPWSMSINVGGDTWLNLISQNRWDDVQSSTYYGFAVDYRGEHPIVYVIIGDRLVSTVVMDQTWVAVYPMLYGGSGVSATPPASDMSINFGVTPFRYNPVAVLTAASVDPTGLELGWGL